MLDGLQKVIRGLLAPSLLAQLVEKALHVAGRDVDGKLKRHRRENPLKSRDGLINLLWREVAAFQVRAIVDEQVGETALFRRRQEGFVRRLQSQPNLTRFVFELSGESLGLALVREALHGPSSAPVIGVADEPPMTERPPRCIPPGFH
ncbi:MAG: hypothetical protein U0935_20315 [Pirellulales bacterium]